MAANNYNKTFSKIIDRVNFADVVYQRYSNKKIRVCWASSKTSGNLVTKPKEKGLDGSGCLKDATIDWLQN